MNQDNTPTEQPSPSEQPAPQAPVDEAVATPTPAEPAAAPTIPVAPAAPAAAGHDVPAAFTSAAPTAPAASDAPETSPPYAAPAGYQGAAFGVPAPFAPAHATRPTEPLTDSTGAPIAPVTPITPKEKKPFGASKVAALIVAAALVGGASGIGGSYLGSNLWAHPTSSTASGPQAVTVNNPGSVNETTAIATKVLPSVVTIEVAGKSESGSGSGVVLSKDGYVLTNTHVVTLGGAEADPTIRVTTSDGHIYDATVVGTDPIYDLAVIKLTGATDLAPITFADSSDLNVGSTAVAVGAPLGLANSVTTGIVSALNRSIEIASSALPDTAAQDAPDTGDDSGNGSGQEGGPFQFDIPGAQQQTATKTISIAVIQTDAAINPGNSGGALVDSKGNLIGINVAIATAGSSSESGSIGVGFSIPSNIAQRVSDEIIKDGAATHGLLGASVRDAASVQGASVSGAYIVEATDGGGAKAAGLTAGDVVTEFNGTPITSASDLTAQVRAAAAGSDATLTYVRDGKTFEANVTLGELSL